MSIALLRRNIFLWPLIALLGACATAQTENGENDPFERFNRATFNFNRVVEHVMLRPVAKTYYFVVPRPARRGVRNVLNNLKTPVTLANDILQGEGKRAGDTLGRFFINSTIGIGGLMDPATGMGLEFHKEDFGQTLAVWGFGEGPYIELPFLGPSNLRDSIGLAGTTAMDPIFWVLRDSEVPELTYVRKGVGGIDTLGRSMYRLDDLERNSLDFYAALRSLYRQDRQAEILNGEEDALPEIPDYFDEEDEGEGASNE